MAEQLKYVIRNDFTSDQDELDLLGFNDGLNLALNGYQPGFPDETESFIEEALTSRIESTDDNNLASIAQKLREFKTVAMDHKNNNYPFGLWLRAQLANESQPRQALIDRLSYDLADLYRPQHLKLQNLTLAHLRGIWEDTVYTTYSDSSVDNMGGIFTYSGNVGDIPARLARFKLGGVSGGGDCTEFWVGLRGNKFGTAANFQSRYELENATVWGSDTTGGTTNPDANCTNGYKAIVDFITQPDMEFRTYCLLHDQTSYPNDQRGRYQVFLRARNSAGSTVNRVRLASGYFGNLGGAKYGQRVVCSTIYWTLFNMGTIDIPTGQYPPGGSESLENYYIGIDAEKVSGGGDLWLDCLILIPIGEGYLYSGPATNAQIQYYLSWDWPFYIMDRANGIKESFHKQSASAGFEGPGSPVVTGGLPIGNGIGVLLTNTLDAPINYYFSTTLDVYQRWEYLRGSET